MEISDLVVRIIILIFPGLLSISLINSLIKKRKIDNREYIVYVIIISFISYFALNLIFSIFLENRNVSFFEALVDSQIPINYDEVFWSSIIAICLGIIIVVIINKGVFYTLCRKIRITNRTGANSVWDELMDFNGTGIENYIYVVDYDNDVVYGGQVINFSSSIKEQEELILGDVIVTKNSDRSKIIRQMEKVYIRIPTDKIYVEIGETINEESSGKKRFKSKSIQTK